MPDKKSQFQSFSDARLIDVVKNAKQFGYDQDTVDMALLVLKERNISVEDLQLTGNLSNHKFEYSYDIYRSYNRSSWIAFIAYVIIVLMRLVGVSGIMGMRDPGNSYVIIFWVIFAICLGVLVKSLVERIDFYKSVGKELDTADQLIFIFIGVPFFIIMFFFYKSRMKEELRMIH